MKIEPTVVVEYNVRKIDMIVKMMGNEDLPDSNKSKSYSLKECDDVTFSRDTFGLNVMIRKTLPGDNNYTETTFVAQGNIYILNSDGKTIETINHMPPAKENICPIPVKYGKFK